MQFTLFTHLGLATKSMHGMVSARRIIFIHHIHRSEQLTLGRYAFDFKIND